MLWLDQGLDIWLQEEYDFKSCQWLYIFLCEFVVFGELLLEVIEQIFFDLKFDVM